MKPGARINLPEGERRKDRERHHRQATQPLHSAAIVVLVTHQRLADSRLP